MKKIFIWIFALMLFAVIVSATTLQEFYKDFDDQTFDGLVYSGFIIDNTRAHTVSYSAFCASETSCDMYNATLDTSGASVVNISFWLNDDDMEPADCYYYANSTTGWNLLGSCDASSLGCSDDVWCHMTWSSSDAQYKHSGFGFRITPTPAKGENAWVDTINITYEEGVADTCTPPGSGDWNVDCSDACDWSSGPYNVPADMYMTGTGIVTLSALMDFTAGSGQEIYMSTGCELRVSSGGEIRG